MNDSASETIGRRINASYGEAFNELAKRYSPNNTQGRLRGNILPYLRNHPLRAAMLTGASALAIGASLYEWGAAMTAAQAIGIAGLLLSREAAKFKDHRHMLATLSLACVAATAQQVFMAAITGDPGSYIPGGMMVAHAAATMGAFAMIPEGEKELRRGITWVGGIAGAGVAAYLSYKYHNGSGLIPAATTLANSVLFSVKDGQTPRARAGYLAANISHLFYWATQPVASVMPVIAEAMLFATNATTLAECDVPVADRKSGRRFGAFEQLTAYFKDVIGRGERSEHVGVTRREENWKRSDEKVYAEIGRAVLGS